MMDGWRDCLTDGNCVAPLTCENPLTGLNGQAPGAREWEVAPCDVLLP